MSTATAYGAVAAGQPIGFEVCDRPAPPPARPRLLDRVRAAIRARHYSPRTEASYVRWIRRFILFHGGPSV